MDGAQLFRWGSVVVLAVVISVGLASPASATVSLDDQSSSPLTVTTDSVTQLTLNQQLGVSASVSLSSSSAAQSGPYATYATAASSSGGAPKSSSGSGSSKYLHPVPGPGPIAGDVNLDNVVDFSDFGIIQSHFGQSVSRREDGDLNGDGVVNFSDFSILQSHMGDYLIPEPASLVIWSALVCTLGIAYGRRRRALHRYSGQRDALMVLNPR